MDLNTNAYRIVSSLTDENKGENKRSAAARNAGKHGGPARAATLSKDRRREIAVKAVQARWAKRAQ